MSESVLVGVPIPVAQIDENYRILYANPAATEMFGRDIVGNSAIGLLRQAPVLAAMDEAIRHNGPGQARFLLTGASGEVVYNFRAHAMQNGGAVLSFEDDSRQEDADQIRRDFVANISHELRTPLTSLLGFIETLRGPAKEDEQARARFLGIMEDEAKRMSRMVSDLLSLSRVETDERVRPREDVDLSAVVRSVIATLEGKLKDAKITVKTEGIDQKAVIKGDRDQLIQLFLNLIENAIKYGGSGQTLTIKLGAVDHDPTLRQPAFRVDIQDQGPGIEAIHLPRLTERFYRVDSHRSREQGGTGLGLAIAKHIINRHKGRIKIISKQDVGSCFSTVFPAE